MADGPVYRRSSNGRTIHQRGCRHYASGVRWKYADRMPPEQVIALLEHFPWLWLCRRCWCGPQAGTTYAEVTRDG